MWEKFLINSLSSLSHWKVVNFDFLKVCAIYNQKFDDKSLQRNPVSTITSHGTTRTKSTDIKKISKNGEERKFKLMIAIVCSGKMALTQFYGNKFSAKLFWWINWCDREIRGSEKNIEKTATTSHRAGRWMRAKLMELQIQPELPFHIAHILIRSLWDVADNGILEFHVWRTTEINIESIHRLRLTVELRLLVGELSSTIWWR